ncbi:ATP-binding cassette domain-containing protein [Litoribaculum gwangyangense]|uniref:ABC transporter domain-containing protein n=1 Tax=Litoribaculum gwangyangense TaxID=1130722 RepID=A0ABP9CHV8_9FLAO
MQKHIAVYISNNDDKETLIERLVSGHLITELTQLKGAFFSEITLDKFINEERRHGLFDITTEKKNSLSHSSEGERKKALLQHLISQNPEYLIVDNIFGNLDTSSQQDIANTVSQLGTRIPIIQITNRKREILPFITALYRFDGETLIKTKMESLIWNSKFDAPLPASLHQEVHPYNTLVKFHNVQVSYGERPILRDICWEIKPGEFWQLMGPNGSGKSTLLTLISGDNPKAYGQDITLFDIKKGSGESVWDIKKNIGFFSADMVRGFARLDAIGNMIVSGFFDSIGLYKTPTNAQIKIAHQWLQVLSLFEVRKQAFSSLSLGHQRLVLIARAMVKSPPLLILDEPTNALDDADAALFCNLVNKIARETRTAIIFVSHRTEADLKPDFVFELTPGKQGSTGKMK